MKKICIFLSSLLSFIFLFTFSACNQSKKSNVIPIKSININFTERTLLIGEQIDFSLSVSPLDNTDSINVKSQNPAIATVHDTTITAINKGETNIIISTVAENRMKSIKIRVIEPVKNTIEFKDKHYSKFIDSTVKVYCKYYNKNIFGYEKDVEIVSGYGTIIRQLGLQAYFITDRNIFDQGGSGQDYEKWYVTDNDGNSYSIAGLDYHIHARVAIGYFTASSRNQFLTVSVQKNVYIGDYAITPHYVSIATRVSNEDYEKVYSNISVNVIYFENSNATVGFGCPVFNSNYELIGIALNRNGSTIIAVSGSVVQELVSRFFNEDTSSSGGGPIDIF